MSYSHTKVKAEPDVRIADVWREVDPRLERYVRVIARYPNGAGIQRCDAKGNLMHGYRSTTALLRRFNGRRGGYALHHRTDENDLSTSETNRG